MWQRFPALQAGRQILCQNLSLLSSTSQQPALQFPSFFLVLGRRYLQVYFNIFNTKENLFKVLLTMFPIIHIHILFVTMLLGMPKSPYYVFFPTKLNLNKLVVVKLMWLELTVSSLILINICILLFRNLKLISQDNKELLSFLKFNPASQKHKWLCKK